ncbi:MAG: ComEC/Rec2 family competence protein, partial [bacterium]
MAEAAACTIAAQLALLPLLATLFGSVPFAGAVANLAVTPAMAVFLAGGIALLALGWIPWLGPGLGWLLKIGLAAVLGFVEACARIPLASVVAPPFGPAALLAFAAWGGGALAWIAAGT